MLSLEKVQLELKRLSGEHDKLVTASSVSEAKDNIIELQEIEKTLLFFEHKLIAEIQLLQAEQEPKKQNSIGKFLFRGSSKKDLLHQQEIEEKIAAFKEELTFANAIRSVAGQVTVPQLKQFIIQKEQETQKSVRYREYIQSAAWRKKAEEAKARAGNRCQVCNRSRAEVQLEAHHRTYERLGNELPEDITVLCRDCHQLYEDKKQADLSVKLCKKCNKPFAPLDETHQFCANCFTDIKRHRDASTQGGFCIRCQTKINLNPQSPYCRSCYRAWKELKDESYQEQYCHICGEEKGATMLKPACYTCYKKHRSELTFQ
ncbi:MAG: HNH endonuclease [Anaerolineae bacterium]|nr:HNH endonuclease [Anaerolineae bacterium]